MPLNKEGLEAGQAVDFETIMRLKAEQKKAVSDGKPKQRREEKTSVRTSDESELQNTPKPARKKKTKTS